MPSAVAVGLCVQLNSAWLPRVELWLLSCMDSVIEAFFATKSASAVHGDMGIGGFRGMGAWTTAKASLAAAMPSFFMM